MARDLRESFSPDVRRSVYVPVPSSLSWVSIQQDTELNAAGISYNEERSQAAVPFTYYASIGSGMAVYDNIVVVNLEYREG